MLSVAGNRDPSMTNTLDNAGKESILNRIIKLNIFSDENNDDQSDDDNEALTPNGNQEDEEDELIKGLSSCYLDGWQGSEFTPKGPVFRRNEGQNIRPSPYQEPAKAPKPDVEVIDLDKSSEDIPILPSINVNTQADKLLVQNVDAYYNANVVLVDPRLIVRKKAGKYIVLPISGRVTIDTTLKKLGVLLPRLKLTDDIEALGDKIEILFQPDPRFKQTVKCEAKIKSSTDEAGVTSNVIIEQFMEMSPFATSGIETLLQGVCDEDVQTAIDLVKGHDSQDLFKTYGPNSDTMLMTCCCKKDATPTIRAQVFALTARILSEQDSSLRRNVVTKNSSGLSALDFTTVTNNARIAVFLAEIFFSLGQDILCKDASGNTILHLMARKGDSVAPTMDALLSLKFNGLGHKVYTSNVANNSKRFLPLHIAAMSSRCPQNILRILKSDFEQGLHSKTWDGSLPLHIACQYSSDPSLIATLLYYDKCSGINERRQDGLTPLHLVSARNEAKDVRLGLIPLDETTQVRMIKLLLEHGADETRAVENYKPVDLLRPDRVYAQAALRRQNYGPRNQDHQRPGGLQAAAPNSSSNRLPILAISGAASSGSSSPDSQLSSGDRSPVMYPQVYNNDPFLSSHNIGSSASESEASPVGMGHWQSGPYSPTAHNGSVSSGMDNGVSDESDEDNSGRQLDAIAQALFSHPTIQAVMDAHDTINPDV